MIKKVEQIPYKIKIGQEIHKKNNIIIQSKHKENSNYQ